MQLEDDYRELFVNAKRALRELLEETEHDGLPTVRAAYGTIRERLGADEREGERESAVEEKRAVRELEREVSEGWRHEPRERREAWLLGSLGDRRLTIKELREAMNAKPPVEGWSVWESNVRSLALTMLTAGQLEREAETFRNKPRYRWHRARGLSGPIADLERAIGGEA